MNASGATPLDTHLTFNTNPSPNTQDQQPASSRRLQQSRELIAKPCGAAWLPRKTVSTVP
ncbi:MAG: hypothetical protein FWD57_16690 [Polyangiaceae bacterium]|nr:hypothetical protein [Polyangiaceae bacterium]